MTPTAAYRAILQTFIVGWPLRVGGTEAAPTVPYAIDNRKLAQPTPPTFAQVDIVNLASDQVTMGRTSHRRFERNGFIDVRLFGARDQGRGPLDTLAEYVRELFEATSLGAVGEDRGVRTYAMTVNEVRDSREFPDLWCLLCRTPFEFHHKR
jgi:hypothetical protein